MSIFAFELPALRVVGVVAGYGLRVADHTLPILLAVLLTLVVVSTLVVVPTLVQNHQLLPFTAPLAWLLWAILQVAVTSGWPTHSSRNFLSKDLSIFSFGELITVLGAVLVVVMRTNQIGTALQLLTDVSTKVVQPIDISTDFYHSSVTLAFIFGFNCLLLHFGVWFSF